MIDCEVCKKEIKEEIYELDDLNVCLGCYSSTIDDAEYIGELNK